MRRGEAWEAVLEIWNEKYRMQGRALIARCHPAVRQNKEGTKWWYEKDGPPDFLGVASGVGPICFDAKRTAGARLSFGKIPSHQAQFFSTFQALGGTAFLAVSSKDGEFVVPWLQVAPDYAAWCRGEKVPASLHPADYTPFGWDGWLPALRLS